MKNKTIVFLHPHFLKPGGASKVVLEQANRLGKKGFKCVVITTCFDAEIIKNYPSVKIIGLSNLSTGSLKFWLTYPKFFSKLETELKSIPDKIVYCHSLAIYWGYFFKLRHPSTTLVYYLHDLGLPYTDLTIENQSLPGGQKLSMSIISPILKLLNKSIFEKSDYVVANSMATAEYLKSAYKINCDLICNPGVDTIGFRPGKTKQSYLYTLGRLEKSKNISTIINAMAGVKNVNLKIIGEGVEKTNLMNLAKQLNLETRIQFLGQKIPKQVNNIAGQAALGLFFGPYETFGIAAAECVCSGTPILGINQGGIGEIIGNHGFGIAIENDPMTITKTINALLYDKVKLQKMTAKAVQSGKELFNWDKQISKLEGFFSKI